jgi:hypothetical protein
MRSLALAAMLLASCAVPRTVAVRAIAAPPLALTAPKFDPPPIDFALTPDVDYCPDSATCRPHGAYGAWIGTAVCIAGINTDAAGVPRRAPNTLFQGDTGCDIGAYQFVSGTIPLPIPGPPLNLRKF